MYRSFKLMCTTLSSNSEHSTFWHYAIVLTVSFGNFQSSTSVVSVAICPVLHFVMSNFSCNTDMTVGFTSWLIVMCKMAVLQTVFVTMDLTATLCVHLVQFFGSSEWMFFYCSSDLAGYQHLWHFILCSKIKRWCAFYSSYCTTLVLAISQR